MLSRNVEQVLWLGRYSERMENMTRMLDAFFQFPLKADRDCEQQLWQRIVELWGDVGVYENDYPTYDEASGLRYLVLDERNVNSIASCARAARDNARALRENIPTELWDVMNGFYLWLQKPSLIDELRVQPFEFLRIVRTWCAQLAGIVDSVMPRDLEWRILSCGRYLERTENTLRMIRTFADFVRSIDSSQHYVTLQAIAKSVSGLQFFRRIHADQFTWFRLLEFVLNHRSFPRSIHYSLNMFEEHLNAMSPIDEGERLGRERIRRSIMKLRAATTLFEQQQEHGETLASEHWYVLIELMNELEGSFSETFFYGKGQSA